MGNTQTPLPDIPIWRYGIISSLLHRDAGGLTLAERLEQASKQCWTHPSGRLVHLSADTLRHWIYRYRKNNVQGLADKVRRDRGSTEIPLRVQAEIRKLRAEHPQFTTGRILKMLTEAGILRGNECSQSALYRFAKCHGLKRIPVGAQAIKDSKAFAYTEFGL